MSLNVLLSVNDSEEASNHNPDADVEISPRGGSAKSVVTQIRSDCPLENGVVYSKWGSIQAGTVIAGIATGYEPQQIKVDEYSVDSRYAATLAGKVSPFHNHRISSDPPPKKYFWVKIKMY